MSTTAILPPLQGYLSLNLNSKLQIITRGLTVFSLSPLCGFNFKLEKAKAFFPALDNTLGQQRGHYETT